MHMTKKTWDDRFSFRNESVKLSTGVPTYSYVLLGEDGDADGIRNRPKPNPLDVTHFVVDKRHDEHGGTGYEFTRLGVRKEGTQKFCFGSAPGHLEIDEASGDVALQKARSRMTEFSFGEAIAESGQTLNMVLGRIAQMALFANNIRRGRWSAPGVRKPSNRLKRTPGSKRLANNWLELQYGWLPAIHDIYDVMEAYSSGLAKRGTKVGKKSSQSVGRANSRGGISGVVVNPTAFNLNQWGLLNPASLAWELTPLSFVFDWFVPVSTTLSALTGSAGLGSVRQWKVDETVRTRYLNRNFGDPSEYIDNWTKHAERSVVSFSIPSFWVKQEALKAGQIANAVALLRQRVF